MNGIEILATGRGIPERVVTNDDLSKIVDTNDEWVVSRTGIRSRHFCNEGETNCQYALEAANKAIARAGISKDEIGLLIVATFTPDYATPSVACLLQKELELPNTVIAFDLNAACSGFLYSLQVAGSMLNDLNKPYALLVGSEQISTRLDMNERTTCVLFGDGAGAAVIGRAPGKLFHSILGAEGNAEILGCSGSTSDARYVYMDGKAVFRVAVQTICGVARQLLEETKLTMDDIDYVICHQANERIIRKVIKSLDAPEEKFFMNIQTYGNTSAASIPIALDEMMEQGLLKSGMKILCVGFGAGLTWGGNIIEL